MLSHVDALSLGVAQSADPAAPVKLTRFDGNCLVEHQLSVEDGPTILRARPSDGAIRLTTPEPALVAAALAGVVGLPRSRRPLHAEPVAVAPGVVRRFVVCLATDRQPAAASLLDHPSLRPSGLRALLDLAAGQATAWWLSSASHLTVVDGHDAGLWAGSDDDSTLQPISASVLWCQLLAAAGPSPTR